MMVNSFAPATPRDNPRTVDAKHRTVCALTKMNIHNRLVRIWRVIKQYIANCNLHGMRYIVEDGRHWTERLFWVVFCGLSWWGCINMVLGVLKDFEERPVAFTIETTYVSWQTEFPSISVCSINNNQGFRRISSEFQKKYGRKLASNTWTRIFTNDFMRTNPSSKGGTYNVLTSQDLVNYYEMAKFNCSELFMECSWKGVEFDCCKEFQPLQTTAGYCYIINTQQVKSRGVSSVNFISNYTVGVGSLYLGFTNVVSGGDSSGSRNTEVYFHNNLEIPSSISYSDKSIRISSGAIMNVGFTVQDTYNEPGLKSVSPRKRNCRFSYETDGITLYNLYSNDACVTQVQVERMLELCGCVVHIYPRLEHMPVCNYSQLNCLYKSKAEITNKQIFNERCLPDCEGMIIRHYNDDTALSKPHNSSELITHGILANLLSLPCVRYRRYVVRSLLDVVVAVGSAAGLFMGASILSVVEIPYWLLLRHG